MSVTTASTVAPLLFRASPIDPALHPSPESAPRDLASYRTSTPSDGRTTPHLPVIADLPKTKSPPNPASPPNTLPPPDFLESKFTGPSRDTFAGSPGNNLSVPPSLPGLSTLASIASAPTSQMRYVSFHVALSLYQISFLFAPFKPGYSLILTSGSTRKGCSVMRCLVLI